MMERLRFWNQYGYQPDVFKKYRDAVARSNRGSLKVMCIVAVVSSLLVYIYGVASNQPRGGGTYCQILLIVGIAGAVIAFYRKSTWAQMLIVGYILGAAVYAFTVFGAVNYDSSVFWIGTHLAVGCYLFDYAWRVLGLQVLSYVALEVSWKAKGALQDPTQRIFCLLYLLISLITVYTLNRARVSLITGREEFRRVADTDQLTGLTARRAAQQEIEDHLQTDEHGVLMLLDLDCFKSVNDRYGHQAGDKVLIDVAADIRKMFRNSDVLSRLGGDEYVVYLKSVPGREWTLKRAASMVEKIGRTVGEGPDAVRVTASVGIVMTDMVGRTYDDLYRAADIAMYNAKNSGGNKALFYSEEMLGKPVDEEKINSLR